MGDPKKCVYRSSWEKKVFAKFDLDKNVTAWCAEPFAIPYVSPKDGRVHRYFPDIIVVVGEGKDSKTTLIEIKPLKETMPPKRQGKKKARQLQEEMTWAVNQAKWKAAKELCSKEGWRWVVMTEKNIKPTSRRK